MGFILAVVLRGGGLRFGDGSETNAQQLVVTLFRFSTKWREALFVSGAVGGASATGGWRQMGEIGQSERGDCSDMFK